MKYFLLPLSFVFLIALPTAGQDIFDCSHSLRYADFLRESGNHAEAALVYREANCPGTDSIRILAVQEFRRAGMFSSACGQCLEWIDLSPADSSRFRFEFSLNALACGERQYRDALSMKPARENEVFFLSMNQRLLTGDYTAAADIHRELTAGGMPQAFLYGNIFKRTSEFKRKKTWFAGLLSGLVPGAGKFYTGRYYDGVSAFSLVAVNGFCAWRGFRREGQGSVLGWVSAGLATGFYLGSIYGSVKSAQRYNDKFDQEIRNETLEIIRRLP